MKIKLSVIIPVYNTEKYLRRCLESVANQNLKEIEIIVVNDGSPDESYKIIDEFSEKDKRVRVINKKNGGLSSARNEGLKIARGEYIIHIDSDDWIEQNYFKDMYEKAKKNNLDILISDAIWDWDDGKIQYRKDLEILDERTITGKEYLNYFLKDKTFPAVWNKLFKSSLYRDNNIEHPENISLGEDLATVFRLGYYAARVGKINKPYIHYIQNPESITKNGLIKKINQLLDAFEILEKFLKEKKENYDLSELQFNHLVNPVYSDYDIDDESYERMINKYLRLNKEIDILKLKSKFLGKRKKYICARILRKIPRKSVFKLIYKFNKIVLKIKKVGTKNEIK